MARFALPLVVMFGLVAAGAILGRVELALLGILGAIGALAAISMRAAQERHAEQELESVHPQDRALLAPLRKLRREIRAIVEAQKGNVAVAVIGAEAEAEADRIIRQSAELLRLRRELRKANTAASAAAREIDELKKEAGAAVSEAEAEALRSALAARELEQAHLARAGDALERIELGLRQAEAALAEMRARLAAAPLEAQTDAPGEDLRETVGRLKALGTSLEEAEEWLKGSSGQANPP
jgi:chromosome segregation ATPase